MSGPRAKWVGGGQGARIDIARVHFRHDPGGLDVLDGLSLHVNPGEIVGIVGRQGAGKSTLARLMQRLCRPQSGRILVDGQDLAAADLLALRRQIGVVVQESMLFARSVRENIAISDLGIDSEQVIRAARLAGAHDFILSLPQGYDTVLGEHGVVLDACQRQRIAIARALATRPRILILDQALVALQPEAERLFQSQLPEIAAETTVVMLGHCLAAVREADRILVMQHGRLYDCESVDETPRPQSRIAFLVHRGVQRAA